MDYRKILTLLTVLVVFVSCSDDYIIGGEVNKDNKVDMTTFEFLESLDETSKTAKLIEKAGMVEKVNGKVTLIAPSNYAVNKYLRRRNNRLQRLNPDTTELTLEDISQDTLQKKLGMYVVDGKHWRETLLDKEYVTLPTYSEGDSLRMYIKETNSEPTAAWDGAGIPGLGYQYSNFMQTTPKKVFVHFKRGDDWEMDPNERISMGYDNSQTDKVYQMYLADVLTTNGVVHIIYIGNENYSAHYYYHTLFFFGTREDDQL